MPTLQEIKDKIDNDPDNIGFKVGADWKSDQEIADLFNDIGSYTIDRSQISKSDVISAVIYNEYNGLLTDEQEWLKWITNGDGSIKVSADVKARLAQTNQNGGIWSGNDEQSANAILALIEFQGSYAQSLWGDDAYITASMVAQAANL